MKVNSSWSTEHSVCMPQSFSFMKKELAKFILFFFSKVTIYYSKELEGREGGGGKEKERKGFRKSENWESLVFTITVYSCSTTVQCNTSCKFNSRITT